MFALSIAYSFLKYVQARVTWRQFRQLFIVSVMVSAGLVFAAVVGLTYAGVIAPWSGRFYSLYDTGLGRERVGVIVRGWQYHQVYVALLNSLSLSLSSPDMLKFIYLSLLVLVSTNPPLGPHSSLIFMSWSACFRQGCGLL